MKDVYDLRGRNVPDLDVSSPDFEDTEHIPSLFTCDGGNHFPVIKVSGIPREVETLAIVVEDPDAPEETFIHFVAWNIIASADQVLITEESLIHCNIGINDFGHRKWGGPCPPKGDGVHHYYFKVYGLDQDLEIPDYSTSDELISEMDLNNNMVAYGELIGEYER